MALAAQEALKNLLDTGPIIFTDASVIAILTAIGAVIVAVINAASSARRESVDTLARSMKTLEEALGFLQAENKRLKERQTELEDENCRQRNEYEAAKEVLRKENDTLKARVSVLEDENRELKSEVEKLKSHRRKPL